MTLPDYVLHNRAHWDKQAPDDVPSAERHWAEGADAHMGDCNVPESDVRMIP